MTLDALCRELGIEILDDTRATRRPGQTHARETLAKIHAAPDRGPDHLKLVLTAIMETENNKLELVAPTIWAVSDLLIAHPTWAERVSELLDAFDTIDLAELRDAAKANRRGAKPRPAIATMLFERLRRVMGDEPQTDLFRRPADAV